MFSSVVHHIIGQQISTVAQNTIWERLSAKFANVDAAGILSLNRDELQSVGITYKKADYILDLLTLLRRGKNYDRAGNVNKRFEYEQSCCII